MTNQQLNPIGLYSSQVRTSPGMTSREIATEIAEKFKTRDLNEADTRHQMAKERIPASVISPETLPVAQRF
jgi:hypothetical protein